MLFLDKFNLEMLKTAEAVGIILREKEAPGSPVTEIQKT
jgi:hypothetical protein